MHHSKTVTQISRVLGFLAGVNCAGCIGLICYSLESDIATLTLMIVYGLQGTVGSLLLWAVSEALLIGAEICKRLKSIDLQI